MPLVRVNQALEQCDDGELRDAKGHDPEGEPQNRPEDRALLLVQAQGVKVLAVSILYCDYSQRNASPLEWLVFVGQALIEKKGVRSPTTADVTRSSRCIFPIIFYLVKTRAMTNIVLVTVTAIHVVTIDGPLSGPGTPVFDVPHEAASRSGLHWDPFCRRLSRMRA